MNNEIKPISNSTQNTRINFGKKDTSSFKNETTVDNEEKPTVDMRESMDYLSSINKASHGLNNSIKKSVLSFQANPEKAQSQIAFGDSLVENGVGLERAAFLANETMRILGQESTYRE